MMKNEEEKLFKTFSLPFLLICLFSPSEYHFSFIHQQLFWVTDIFNFLNNCLECLSSVLKATIPDSVSKENCLGKDKE